MTRLRKLRVVAMMALGVGCAVLLSHSRGVAEAA
jgi:hypothetical protein